MAEQEKNIEEKRLIAKVYENKKSKQKLVTIPQDSEINSGDYVEVKKI